MALGAADYSAKNYAEAIKNMDMVIARDPGMVNAYWIKGVCYESLKDEENMVETYKKTIEVASTKGDAATAQKAQTQLTKYFFNTGVTAQKAQKWDDAIAAFLKAVEIDNTSADAFYSLSACYNNKKSWDNAISNAEKALEIRTAGDGKNLDGIYYQLGTAYAGKNDKTKACENFKKVGEGPFLAGAKYQIETALKCQ
jgi:tetratricopeptide (TPR) repeat protein